MPQPLPNENQQRKHEHQAMNRHEPMTGLIPSSRATSDNMRNKKQRSPWSFSLLISRTIDAAQEQNKTRQKQPPSLSEPPFPTPSPSRDRKTASVYLPKEEDAPFAKSSFIHFVAPWESFISDSQTIASFFCCSMQVKKKDEQVQKDKVCFFPLSFRPPPGHFVKETSGL